MGIIERLRQVVKRPRRRKAIEDKSFKKEVQFSMEAPRIGKPYIPKDYPNKFYEYDSELSKCVAGYKKGPRNPYVEKLMKLSAPSEEKE